MRADVPRFALGELVFHKTDDTPGVIVGLVYRPGGMVYEVTWQGRITESHYECELTTDKPEYSQKEND